MEGGRWKDEEKSTCKKEDYLYESGSSLGIDSRYFLMQCGNDRVFYEKVSGS